jgi:arsenite methyltransferase
MTDRWAAWLLERRFGADPAHLERMLPRLAEYRDTVLAGARIEPGDVVLDVGCGDGLLGAAAVDRVGEAGTVIFSDVSAELLARCREITDELDATDRCRFVHTGLPELDGIATESVDVAMTRSVLIYVADKAGSFATFHRVLRPGGRLSIFEPINRFHNPEPAGVLWGFDVTGLEALADNVKDTYRRHQPDDDPMLDFDERDLLRHAETAGFTEIQLNYRAEIGPDPVAVDWETFLRTAPNPLVPAFGEILTEALDPAEHETLANRMRDQVGAGVRVRRFAVAYLTAFRS